MVDTQKEQHKPYHVQSIVQSSLPRPTTDKILDSLQLLFITRLKSAGVMEHITVMICECQFVLDVMFATLYKQDPHDQPSPRKISLPNLYGSIEMLNLERQ